MTPATNALKKENGGLYLSVPGRPLHPGSTNGTGNADNSPLWVAVFSIIAKKGTGKIDSHDPP